MWSNMIIWNFLFFFVQRLCILGVFKKKKKNFKTHRLTLCISLFNGLRFSFSVISEVSLSYITQQRNWIVFVYKTVSTWNAVSSSWGGRGDLVHDILRVNNAWIYFINSWTMYLTCKICTVLCQTSLKSEPINIVV